MKYLPLVRLSPLRVFNKVIYVDIPLDNFVTVVSENPDCLLLSGLWSVKIRTMSAGMTVLSGECWAKTTCNRG